MSEKVEQVKESRKEKVKEEITKDDSTSVLTFDPHPYFPFLFDPYSSSKYGSQVRERKIDRCLKQLQDALNGGKYVILRYNRLYIFIDIEISIYNYSVKISLSVLRLTIVTVRQ